MPFRCPSCSRVLYNRRRVTCEFCAAVIPSGLRMSETQKAAIDRLKADEIRAHREFMERNRGGVDGNLSAVDLGWFDG